MKVQHNSNPLTRRVQAYPDIGDQLDAIWKILIQLEKNGGYDVHQAFRSVPEEAIAVLDRIKQIKTIYPKRG